MHACHTSLLCYLLRGEDDDHANEPHEEGEGVEEAVRVIELGSVLDHFKVVRAEIRLCVRVCMYVCVVCVGSMGAEGCGWCSVSGQRRVWGGQPSETRCSHSSPADQSINQNPIPDRACPSKDRSYHYLVGRPDGDGLRRVVQEEEGEDHEGAVRPDPGLPALLRHRCPLASCGLWLYVLGFSASASQTVRCCM